MKRKNDREYNIKQLVELFNEYTAYNKSRYKAYNKSRYKAANPETLELIRAHAACNDDFKVLLEHALYPRYQELLVGEQDFESKRAAGEQAASDRFDLKNELRALDIGENNVKAVLQAVRDASTAWFYVQSGRPVP